jgi:hypothetical protein
MLLKHLKRWLGWERGSGLLDFGALDRVRPPPAPSPPPVKPAAPSRSAARPAARRGAAPPPPAPPRAKPKTREPLDALDNPRLSLDKPADDGFDPYNTGAFNRSASWEKIGRQRKR